MHHRLVPKKNKFTYDVFMFYIDLDELPFLKHKFCLLGFNRSSLFSFYDKDHANTPQNKPTRNEAVKVKITEYINSKGIHRIPAKVRVLTNLTTLGYLFNPVSFYYLFDEEDHAFAAVAEVCNTFGEMKLYVLDESCLVGDTFSIVTPKNFYVSPFSKVDIWFHYILKIPSHQLLQRVDDYDGLYGSRTLLSAITGKRQELTDFNMLKNFCSIPFITLKIIFLIHWQALRLYLMKVPYFKKKQDQQFQQDYIKL